MKWAKYALVASLIFPVLFVFSIKITQAQRYIVRGSNFQIYLTNGQRMAFQHLAIGYVQAKIFNVTVSSGTLNGTNGILWMWIDRGELSFLSQDSAVLTAPDVGIIVNGNFYDGQASISNGDKVELKWSCPSLEPLIPIMFGLGMLGLAGTFAGPLYAIHLIKKKKYYDGFISGLIITSFSLALLISWLWQ